MYMLVLSEITGAAAAHKAELLLSWSPRGDQTEDSCDTSIYIYIYIERERD